ncbi:MAG: hypothetical protein ACPG5P_09370, partial [Saprospiraceae bacterium]
TPSHSNCWNYSSGKCEKEVSNNIMDYNLFRNAWTPCQIGIVHRNMTLQNQRQRKMLVKDWCVLDENKSISISSNEDWNREVDLFGHLTIETGATLSVGCRVSLPKDARILIRPGGTLVLEEAAFLHNDCGELWDGIVVEREGKLKGIVKYYGKPRILDSKNPFEFPEL